MKRELQLLLPSFQSHYLRIGVKNMYHLIQLAIMGFIAGFTGVLKFSKNKSMENRIKWACIASTLTIIIDLILITK